ncbi:hypothetical protein JHU04_001796 [Brenneria sp. 4F2]|nr:hypothetical protein [Brenneria bubanii]
MSLIFFKSKELNNLVDEYEKKGHTVIISRFERAVNIYDVFDEIKKSLPLDPPLYSKCHFDAFSDSIYGGLDLLEKNNMCVFLVGMTQALKDDVKGYHLILDILVDNIDYFKYEEKKVDFLIS